MKVNFIRHMKLTCKVVAPLQEEYKPYNIYANTEDKCGHKSIGDKR